MKGRLRPAEIFSGQLDLFFSQGFAVGLGGILPVGAAEADQGTDGGDGRPVSC